MRRSPAVKAAEAAGSGSRTCTRSGVIKKAETQWMTSQCSYKKTKQSVSLLD